MYRVTTGMYQGHTVPRPFSLFPVPVWCPVQKFRPIFLVDKSIHDEASPFKNNFVNLTISTMGDPISCVFLYVVIIAQSGVHGYNLRPEKR